VSRRCSATPMTSANSLPSASRSTRSSLTAALRKAERWRAE
jgi:hypothetical protein